jgi:predicted metal-dependent hydrolase
VSHEHHQTEQQSPALSRAELDPHYLGFFDCFNQQRFFEAHEVLEELWLVDRSPDRAFYQGLIQLAGAFVHFQKNRLKPAASLLRLTASNLGKYPSPHHQFAVQEILGLIIGWLEALEKTDYLQHPFSQAPYPKLSLLSRT